MVTPESGAAMVAARKKKFKRLYGFDLSSQAISFLTKRGLDQAANEAGLSVKVWYADDSWLKRLRRAWTHRRIGRVPPRFPLIVLERYQP